MKFSISSLVPALDPYQPSSFAVGLDNGKDKNSKFYVMKFVSDLRQVSGFLWFPPPIKLKYC
jgi:hypothetical protein